MFQFGDCVSLNKEIYNYVYACSFIEEEVVSSNFVLLTLKKFSFGLRIPSPAIIHRRRKEERQTG